MSPPSSPPSGAATRQIDIGFQFQVVVTGLPPLGEFLQVEPISVRHEPFTYQEGGRASAHSLYGPRHYGEIVLRWGMMDRLGLWSWIDLVKLGTAFRKNGTIYQYPRLDGAGPLRTYHFSGAWPIEWKSPSLNSMASEIPVEELRLACDFFSMEATP